MKKGYSFIGMACIAAALSACQTPVYTQDRNENSLEYGESYYVMNAPVSAVNGLFPDHIPQPSAKPAQFAQPEELVPEAFADAGAALSGEELGEIRGTFSPNQANLNLLEGIAAHNSILNSVNGGNVISQGTFEGTSGLVNVIQNSGNGVVIQSAMIVNLNLGPTTQP